ncbi:MAG TPA: radical SAM protein [Candidatus Thorarchaeota archaeon]|nr:MAG: hypothetical protein DRO73_10215 [Candidatus Thorarchaeota archaeon]RLI62410.1 MAG: hypothetical protein DRO93_01270 [Candidatus Thorarchaeota archaeon]HDD67188.1 radical SAM protein [Candidatus Thorarchaeota archaeon]
MRIASIIDISLVDVPGIPVTVIFTAGCNFDCPYCQNAELIPRDSGEEMAPEEVVRRTQGFLSEGFCVTGGEPTIHGDLPDLLEALRGQDPRHINLNTQGSVPNILRRSLPFLDSVWFDLKAAPGRYRDVVRTRSNPWPRIEESLRLLLDSSAKVWPRTTYVGNLLTPEDIREIMDVLVELGFSGEYLVQNYVDSQGVRPSEAEQLRVPSADELDDVVRNSPRGIRVRLDWR